MDEAEERGKVQQDRIPRKTSKSPRQRTKKRKKQQTRINDVKCGRREIGGEIEQFHWPNLKITGFLRVDSQ